jgi:hypothetical protein
MGLWDEGGRRRVVAGWIWKIGKIGKIWKRGLWVPGVGRVLD